MKRIVALLLGVMLVLVACGANQGTPEPPKIHYGEDVCSDCGMIINDARFAGAYAIEKEPGRFESYIFDDVGDMLAHMQKNQTLKAVEWWVHDFNSEEWIAAKTASYVVSDQIKSPMNHGIAAFAKQADAEAFAAQYGVKPLDWDKLRIEQAMAEHGH